MRPDDLIGLFVVLLTAGIMLFAISRGLHHAAELSETWRKLAERHRLRFNPGRKLIGTPAVEGTLQGRYVRVGAVKKSDKTYAAQLQVDVHGSLPSNLRLGPPRVVYIIKDDEACEVHSAGPVAFDEHVSVKAKDEEQAVAYLNESRRKAALSLVKIGGRLEEGKLRAELKKADQELERIDRTLIKLLELAPAFDAA